MNRRLFPIAFAAVLLMGSCTAELPMDPEVKPQDTDIQATEPQVTKENIVLSAYSADESATKSSRDGDGHFFWSPNDAISVFYGSGNGGGDRFVTTCTEAVATADFTGTMDENREPGHQYWAIYPYNALNEWDEENQVLVTEIPSHQVAAEGTFADGQFISIGHSDTQAIGFYHLCGGFKFFLDAEGITKITLQGKGQSLAGLVEVKMDENDRPYVSNVLEPKDAIVLTPPAGESVFKTGTDYFFVTMPVTFNGGFNVIFEIDGTKQVGARLVSNNLTIRRAKFQWSTVAYDNGVSFVALEEPDIVKTNVRTYLDNVDYSQDCGDPDQGGYSYSVFKAPYSPVYSYASTSGNDQPKAVSITWSGRADMVTVSTSPSFDDPPLQIGVSKNATSTSVYNLIPGVVYYYKVTNGNSEVKNGCFKPKGTLRPIYIAGSSSSSSIGIVRNFRDMGGWKAGDKTIRYGKLYRGAKISKSDVTTSASAIFRNSGIGNLGIGLDMELRGGKSDDDPIDSYYQDRPFPEIAWTQYSAIKFLGVVERNPGLTAGLYRQAIKEIISFLQTDKRAVYFHCEGGADRTGTLAFLIEALLGVSENDMSKDYELTTFRSSSTSNSYQRYRHIELDKPELGYSDYELKYPFRDFIRYIWTFEGSTIQQKVTTWAKIDDPAVDGDDALTDTDIELLKALLLE